MKRKTILFLISVSTLLIINSCAPSTPAARIAKYPALFENLPESQKELVQDGQIKKGMHSDGVVLAWGKPAGVSEGSRNGKSYEKWVYTSSSPVYRNSFYNYGSYGYGRYGCRRSGYGIGYSPQVYYVQRTAATVEFDHNKRVTEWVTRR